MGQKLSRITLTPGMRSLIGFGIKSGQVVRGFTAVFRSVQQQQIQMVLLDETLGKSNVQKITAACRRSRVPVLTVIQAAGNSLPEVTGGVKIAGLRRGSIAAGFVDQLKQEYQWL